MKKNKWTKKVCIHQEEQGDIVTLSERTAQRKVRDSQLVIDN